MYSEDFQSDSAVEQDEVEDHLDLEESELEDENNAYLVTDDEISEEFQFQG